MSKPRAWGQSWRSSRTFILIAIIMALFTDVFLYGFIVPILPYMLEGRLGWDKSKTQSLTLALLSESALVGLIASPVVGHIADRTSHKKSLLLLSLGGAMVGSVALALARSSSILFISRGIQAAASNAIFVLGLATIADHIPSERMGQTMGLVTTAVSTGTSAGTMLAGVLLETIGYWPTWFTAFSLIAIDAVFRLLMIEKDRDEAKRRTRRDSENDPLLADHRSKSYDSVRSSRSSITTTRSAKSDHLHEEKSGLYFYIFLFQQRRFVGGVICYIVYSIIISSFDTTLPLHVRDAFNWGSLPAGLLFLALQGPGVLLGAITGNLKDRVGTRWPTAIAFLITAPSLLLMGMPGDERFSWFNAGDRGRIMYTICMTVIGCMIPLLNSVGTLEVTLSIESLQTDRPGIFGPHGGTSRAISIANMSWVLGIFIGPIVSGTLVEKFGYFAMSSILAALCTLSGLYAIFSLGPRPHDEIESD
ncbi:hypothetical protein VTL71DRAFT_7756 [Oculimacula yallundae]|uniref:Major facilitator superfamily (MFS) profile domain-containing protein n=1 Tax=Oculimacula yallundae TaxID=86028 RepID=A0ABR4CW18_9HELO